MPLLVTFAQKGNSAANGVRSYQAQPLRDVGPSAGRRASRWAPPSSLQASEGRRARWTASVSGDQSTVLSFQPWPSVASRGQQWPHRRDSRSRQSHRLLTRGMSPGAVIRQWMTALTEDCNDRQRQLQTVVLNGAVSNA